MRRNTVNSFSRSQGWQEINNMDICSFIVTQKLHLKEKKTTTVKSLSQKFSQRVVVRA